MEEEEEEEKKEEEEEKKEEQKGELEELNKDKEEFLLEGWWRG